MQTQYESNGVYMSRDISKEELDLYLQWEQFQEQELTDWEIKLIKGDK